MLSLAYFLMVILLGFFLAVVVQVMRLFWVNSEAVEIDLRDIERWDS